MSRLEIENITDGQIFYEIDHGVAVMWKALEKARRIKPGVWAVMAVRGNGTVLEFLHDETKLCDQSKMMRLFSWLPPGKILML